jgi:hypothetical protein
MKIRADIKSNCYFFLKKLYKFWILLDDRTEKDKIVST